MGWLASEATLLGSGPDALLDVALRVAAEGKIPDPAITEVARVAAPALATADPERLRVGIEAVIMSRGLDLGLQWMHDAGVLKFNDHARLQSAVFCQLVRAGQLAEDWLRER